MRQHVMKEFDKDNDRMVSYEEFNRGLNAPGAKDDQGWKVNRAIESPPFEFSFQSIEDQPIFSDQEFQNFSIQMDRFSTVKSSPVRSAPDDVQRFSFSPFHGIKLLHHRPRHLPFQSLLQVPHPHKSQCRKDKYPLYNNNNNKNLLEFPSKDKQCHPFSLQQPKPKNSQSN